MANAAPTGGSAGLGRQARTLPQTLTRTALPQRTGAETIERSQVLTPTLSGRAASRVELPTPEEGDDADHDGNHYERDDHAGGAYMQRSAPAAGTGHREGAR